MALRGNPGEAAVACLLNERRLGKRIGVRHSYAAAYYSVELALDHAEGSPLEILTCQVNATAQPGAGNEQYGEVGSRVYAKLKASGSRITFRKKNTEPRFDMVNAFARQVLDSGDPIWVPNPIETRAAIRERATDQAVQKIESPAESPVYEALKEHFTTPDYVALSKERSWEKVPCFRGEHGYLVPQFRIGQYRADFAVIGALRKLVVEVDGWTYHSSREAFENDRRRDRELQLRCWQPVRYTASEAMYEPLKCAEQILDILLARDEE